MGKWIRYMKGYVRIRLESTEPERFLSLCVHNQIPVWNLTNHGIYYEMELYLQDLFKLRPFCRKTHSRIIILKKHGMPFFFQKSKKRKAFFLGFLCFFVMIYLCSLYIWDIRLEGNHYYSSDTILEELKTFDVTDGILKRNIDCQKTAEQLRGKFPNIIWVSAKITGTCLILNIKENEDSYMDNTENVTQLDNWNLTANRDGTIVSIVTRAGMPQVMEGSVCKAGDVLVSGEIEILNNDSEVVRYEYVKADADIRIKTTYAYYDEFSLAYKEKQYTGEQKDYPVISILGKEFSFGILKNGDYDICKSTKPLYLTPSFCLPFSYGFVRQMPYTIQQMKYSSVEAKQKSLEHQNEYLKKLVSDGILIINKNINTTVTSDKCIAKGKITVIETTGKRTPIVRNK